MSDDAGRDATFESLLAVMGPFTTNLSVDPAFFGDILKRLQHQFGVEFVDAGEAFALFSRAARSLGASYRQAAMGMSRSSFMEKLTALSDSARCTLDAIEPFRGSMKVWTDRETLSPENPVTYGELFLEFVSYESESSDKPFEEIDADIEAAYNSLKLVLGYCEDLLPGMEGLPAKRGQRGLRWYDDYLEVMLRVAAHLGIGATTDARSSEIADVTAFTMLVFECERIFPAEAHSETPVACARRIERSLKRLREAQQKSLQPR